jgi:hypothetical protein
MGGNVSKKEKIGRIIEGFLENAQDVFSLEELTDYVQSENTNKKSKHIQNITPKELDSWLETSRLVFKDDDGSFIPRALFFKGAEFIIALCPEEVDGFFLIPGHRFTPFCSDRIKPWEYVLLNGEKKEKPKKIIREKMTVLVKYYNLFGMENMIELLAEDHEAINSEIFTNLNGSSPENLSLIVKAFDLAKLFEGRKFSKGEKILIKVNDWNRGICTYEYLSKEACKERERQKTAWGNRLEEGFAQTFDRFGLNIAITEQLAYAYFYAGAEILKDPPVHFGQIFNESKKIFLVPLGMNSILWNKKEIDISSFGGGYDEDGDNSKDPPDSLNGILAYLESLFKDVHIESFMRDELFLRRGEMDDEGFSHVRDRLFPEGEPDFESQKQKRLFLKLCRDMWNKTGKSYNYFADQKFGKLRTETAEILEDIVNWFYSYSERCIGINEKDIPIQEMTMLMQTISMLTDVLHLLNGSQQMDKSNDLEEIKKMLPLVRDKLAEERQKLETKIVALRSPQKGKGGNWNLKLVKPKEEYDDDYEEDHEEYHETEKEEARNIFVLRVSIKYIKPSIWRSIQVPGSYTLGDLHNIIQIAMGWEMDHMHVFTINKEEYGPKDGGYNSDMFDYEEEDFTLDSLGFTEKDKFFYRYDFGDDWDHLIQVSKIIPASEADPIHRQEPFCLKGKRACPPEDIGGIYGYERMLEQLRNRDEIDPDMEWLKDYDSEYCNVDEINERLRDG